MIKLWHNPNKLWQKDNVEKFREFMLRHEPHRFFHPNEMQAPWHVQRWVNGNLVNFYPHLAKAYAEGYKIVNGIDHIENLLMTLEQTNPEEDFDVIE